MIFLKHYERMGFPNGFKPFGSIEEFQGLILNLIDDIEADVFLFLCDYLDKLEQETNDEHLTNYRVCRFTKGKKDEEYEEIKESGCCTTFDKKIRNPKTNNIL